MDTNNNRESGMARVMREWILPIMLSILAIISAWSLFAVKANMDREAEQDARITKIEQSICTKAEIKEIMVETIDGRFDRFELFLQQKYKITPKK
jgi:hypothetical protein